MQDLQTLHTEFERAHRGETAGLDQDEFLALLSHELRTPLGALLAASEVLGIVVPGSPDDAEARAVIARQTRRLAQVLNELLAQPPLN